MTGALSNGVLLSFPFPPFRILEQQYWESPSKIHWCLVGSVQILVSDCRNGGFLIFEFVISCFC